MDLIRRFSDTFGSMAHESSNVPGMRFTCDRSWESMTATDRGRFCDSCQKPVIDFTGWSRAELIAWFKREPDTCGMLERHQIDTRYIPIEQVGRNARRGFFAVLTAFGLGAVQAQAPAEPARTEQDAGTPGSAAQRGDRTFRHYSVNPKKTWEVCPTIPDKAPRRNKVRVYLSGYFPFVHVGKRRFRTVGCPSF
jgi:hypothetical protein